MPLNLAVIGANYNNFDDAGREMAELCTLTEIPQRGARAGRLGSLLRKNSCRQWYKPARA